MLSKKEQKRLLIHLKKRIQKYVVKILKVDHNYLTYNKSIYEYLSYHKIRIEGNIDDWILSQYQNKDSHLYQVTIPRKKKSYSKPKLNKTLKYLRNVDTFYDSNEWQFLRKRTLKRYGCICMKCKSKNTEMHVDHIKPRSKYPELERDENNLQVLCRGCNMIKSNKNEIDYRCLNVSNTISKHELQI